MPSMPLDDYMRLAEEEIEKQYGIVRDYHAKFLKKFGVVLPGLYANNGKFTKDALVLAYLSFGYPNTIAPSEEHHHLLFPTLQIQMPTLHTYSMLVGDAVNDGGFHGGLYDAASIGAVGLA